MISKNIKVMLAYITVFLLTMLPINISGVAHADELNNAEQTITQGTNIGVSEVCPEALTRGTGRPSNTWEINKSGQYNFAGSSYYQTLYTNWKFKGKSSYTIKINNTGSGNITIKAKTLLTTYSKTQVGSGKSATINLSGMNPGTAFYLTFDGSNFSFDGYIK